MSFMFYVPVLILDKFDWTIYGSGVVMGVSELIAYIPCYWMITRIGRRITAYWCFAIGLICSLALLIIWQQGEKGLEDGKNTFFVMFFFFILRFAMTV